MSESVEKTAKVGETDESAAAAEKTGKADKAEKAKKKKEKKPFFLIRFWTGLRKYFRDTHTEMKKVVWPSKKQVLNNCLVVIVVVLICGAVIYGIDNLFGLVLRLLLKTT